MADSVSNLRQMIADVEAALLTLTPSVLPGSSLDGESIDLGAERDRLLKLRRELREQLIEEEGPVEARVQGWTS